MSNTNTDNVSAVKGNVAGAVFVAPKGTAVPTDATTTLAATYKCLGHVSEDGLTMTFNQDSDTEYDWAGVPVNQTFSNLTDTYKLKLLEILNPEVLKAVYGDDAVTGTSATADGGIKVAAGAHTPESRVWVFDMILKGNVLKRIVIPDGVVTEIGDTTYKGDESSGYELTISANDDGNGKTHYEYMGKTA